MPRPPVLLSLLILFPIRAVAQTEHVTLAGDEVAVYNLVGTARLEPGTGSLTVDVTRDGAGGGRLRLAQGEIAGRNTLRVIYPSDRVRAPGTRGMTTTVRVRQDGTFDGDEGGGSGRRVTITDRGDGIDARADLVIRVPAGARVALYLAAGSVTLQNVNGDIRIDAHAAPVSASGTRGSLHVDVGTGQVEVAQASGELAIDTGSGDVGVSGFRGTRLGVETGSGDVTGGDLTADLIAVETGSGDVRLTGVVAPSVSLSTGSGAIDADLRSDITKLSAETGSGDISIRAPATLGAAVEIETASGDIESDFPLTLTRRARDHVVGTIGNGRGKIAIETGSGEVRLLKRPG